MRQLYSREMTMTFETGGIPPLVQMLVCDVYLPPGNLLLHQGSIWREYILTSILPELNEEGKRMYEDDTFLREAYAGMREKESILFALCDWILEMSEVSWADIQSLLDAARDYVAPYRYFDTWFTDGAYQNRTEPAVTTALQFAETTKNVIRETFTILFFEPGKGFSRALAHIGSLYGVPFEDLCWYFPAEVESLCNGKELVPEILARRRAAYVHFIDTDSTSSFLEGEEAQEYIAAFESEAARPESPDTLKGTPAHSTGTLVRGRVRIINSDYLVFSRTERAMKAMERGDILVSTTTAPDLLPAMRKATAIITDLGGMLSHAGITARELGTPCIVGTKFATKILKDGDLVEVDAEMGIIRVLERA